MKNLKENLYYTPKLHQALKNGVLSDKKSGLYLVSIRSLKKDSNVLIYSYIYYPSIFIDSLIAYLFQKSNYKSSMLYKDWGDFFVVAADNFKCYDVCKDIFNNKMKYNVYWIDFINSDEYGNYQNDNEYHYFDLLKKLCHNCDINSIIEIIDYCEKKKYDKLLYVLTNNEISVDVNKLKEVYFLKDCLFVVQDLKTLLDGLKDKGYNVNRGPKNQRAQLNSMNSFLSCIDVDYRSNLYKYHLNRISSGAIPKDCFLSRSHFSFNNIHMKLGNAKLYSTNAKTSSGRQDLFQSNYNVVSDILDKNYHMGSVETQKKIESALLNQERLFSDANIAKLRLNFNDETYDFFESKTLEITKLLNSIDELGVKGDSRSTMYIGIVKDIINKLGKETVAKMLISYFMEILTWENGVYEDEVITSGKYILDCYHKFGYTIFNKFISKLHKESDMKNEFLSVFVDSIKKDYDIVYNNDGGYALMGGYFIHNLILSKLLYTATTKHPKHKEQLMQFIRVEDDVRKLVFKENVRILHLPQKLPMICKPKSFEVYPKLKLGGYLLNDVNYAETLIIPKKDMSTITTINNDNIIIDMVNGFMKTPYKINNNTLLYIYKFGIEKKMLTDLTDDIKEYMVKPYKKYGKKEELLYKSLVSKILMEKNVLSIAEVYSKVNEIYFPVRLDNRTRIYCNTEYFDFQKNDLAKGLISFARAGNLKRYDIESINYFKGYGANMFGLDKKSLNYRVKWVDDNKDKLVNFENNDIVDNAESKACFVSFCFEYRDFIRFLDNKDLNTFKTHLPIQLDATCNGYQHLALLTKESKLLSKLNLDESTFDNDPSDFYTYLNGLVTDYIKNLVSLPPQKRVKICNVKNQQTILNKLLKVKLDRSIIKNIVMKESYSATVPTLADNIIKSDAFTFYKAKNFEDSYYIHINTKIKFKEQDFVVYIMCIKKVLASIASRITKLSTYLQKIVTICTALNMPIPWTLPSGAVVSQSYLDYKEEKIAAFSFTKTKYTFTRYLKDRYDIRQQQRAIRPNLIHSLDATTIGLLYKSLNNVDLYTVHDCFAVTADNVPLLIKKLNLVYFNFYSNNNYLIEFDKMVKTTLYNTFGKGKFNIDTNEIYIPKATKFRKKNKLYPTVNEIINLNGNDLVKEKYPDINEVIDVNANISFVKKSKYSII